MQIRIAKQIVDRFYYKKRIRLYIVVFLALISSLFEYLGLFLIFQFMLVLSNPNSEYSINIVNFFKNNLSIQDDSNINLILGISIALIYIFKNIYMYFFTKINSSFMQDLSVETAIKIIGKMLYCDFVKINSIANEYKHAIISKIEIVIWRYFVQYINLSVNIAIVLLLIAFLFIKLSKPAIISFAFISVLFLIEYKILKSKSEYQNKYFGFYFNKLAKTLHKIINAGKEIMISNKRKYFLSEVKEKYKNMAIMNKKACINGVFHIFFTEISVMVVFIAILLVLYFTNDFDNQTVIVTIGTIIAVILRITPAVNRMQSAIYGINSNENIALEVLNFDKKMDEVEDILETEEKLPFKNAIKLKNISYSYPNSEDGLKNINLTINKGEFIGIVGHSGCYKTTLSLIISGLIKPQKGELYIDENLVDKNSCQKWQNNISILSQDFSILQDDIFEELDDETIEKLELTGLNNNPLLLSFGQKQRVALAHKLIQNKELLILDEATSSLDVLSEEKINNVLHELKGKKTIISIAHRLQILKHCDRIIYMDKGGIIDIDTFQNLNKKYDEFAKIIKLSDFRLDK